MKTSTFVALAIAAVPALARDCTTGIKYCGHTLISIGNYHEQIAQATWDSKKIDDVNEHTITQSVFLCVGGGYGILDAVETCPRGCRENGEGNDDSCI